MLGAPLSRRRRRSTGMRTGLFTIVLALFMAVPAFPWGPEGHQIIALIATRYLSLPVAAAVNDLLAADGSAPLPQGLADVSTWADEIRSQRPETAAWHFTDIPLSSPSYERERDCINDQCSVEQISRLVAVLQDPLASQIDQVEALKFLVHIAGDLHQPLHAADNDDHGGNDVKVEFFGRCVFGTPAQCVNLHRIWDTDILHRSLADAGVDVGGYAEQLAASIQDSDREQWSMGTVEAWANDSHDVARGVSYGQLPVACSEGGACSSCSTDRCPGGFQYVLASEYQSTVAPPVDLQLRKGGVRLATLLNGALAPALRGR